MPANPLTTLETALAKVRAAHPRASLIYALVLIRLLQARGRHVRLVDLCEEIGGHPDSSGVNAAVSTLADLGLVEIDRPEHRNAGYGVRWSEGRNAA